VALPVTMPARTLEGPHKKSYSGEKNHLVDMGRKLEVNLGAQVRVLLLRGWYWCSDKTTRETPDAWKWGREVGTARRLKESCAYKRNTMVRQANYISSHYRADVYIYMTRNGRWYSHEAKFVVVSDVGNRALRTTDENRILMVPSNNLPSVCGVARFRSTRSPRVSNAVVYPAIEPVIPSPSSD